ncbi:MAG: TetR-like C-terminal domain-containing protein [Chloroflexota bacterium]
MALDELGEVMAAAVAGGGPEPNASPLQALAAAYRRFASEHPERYTATFRAAPASHPGLAGAGDDALRTVFAILADVGIADDDLVHTARAIRASLHGFVALEAAQGFGLPQEVDRSFVRMVDALERGLGGDFMRMRPRYPGP